MLSRVLAPANATRQGMAASARVANRRGSALPSAAARQRMYSSRAGTSQGSTSTKPSGAQRSTVLAAATAATAAAVALSATYSFRAPSHDRMLHLDGPAAKRKSYVERMRDDERAKARTEGGKAKDDGGDKQDVSGSDPGVGHGDTAEADMPPAADSLDELSEEASQESAFDPETNTINWDCPCLGGMAHGPCGEEFKTAFSCFVFSEAEPKGIDCVENFKAMQDCFRKHPEHYKEELEDFDEADEQADAAANAGEASEKGDAGGRAAPGKSTSGSQTTTTTTTDDGSDEDDGLKEWRAELAKEK